MSPTKSSLVPVAIEYIVIQPQMTLLENLTSQSITGFQYNIILQAQGDPIELPDEIPPLISALTFATIYNLVPETVLRLANNQLVLLFDHHSHQFTKLLRPTEIEMSIWAEILKTKNKSIVAQNVSDPLPQVKIDLFNIWNNTDKHADIITRTKLFIKLLKKYLQPGLTINLHGELPNLPLLVAIYLARPYGHTINYTDKENRTVTLFS